MRPLADLLHLVVNLDLEAEATAIDLGQLDGDGHPHALGRGGEVLEVDDGADGRLPRPQVRLDALDGGLLDQPDHLRGREDANGVAAQVRRGHVLGDRHGLGVLETRSELHRAAIMR